MDTTNLLLTAHTERLGKIETDIGWIKRAVFGLYGVAGVILAAFLASLAHGQSPHETAHVLLKFLT